MKMKKLLSAALAAAMVLSLAACGKKDQPAQSGSQPGSQSASQSGTASQEVDFSGLITFHGPTARSPMAAFTRRHFEQVLGTRDARWFFQRGMIERCLGRPDVAGEAGGAHQTLLARGAPNSPPGAARSTAMKTAKTATLTKTPPTR